MDIWFFIILFIGFFFLKFIYDSYLTNNTEKRWAEHKRNLDESNLILNKVDPKNDFTIKKVNINEKQDALKRAAESYDCEIWEVKEKCIEEFKAQNIKSLSEEAINEIYSKFI